MAARTARTPEIAGSTIDRAEVDRFARLAREWWNPAGKFRPLHKFNPVRLAYIRNRVCEHFGRDKREARPFEGLRFLDIGCGGGLLCEPMRRLGADVVGADAAETNVAVARLHAEQSGLEIDYRATTAEALAEAGETFDVILNMEVVEHVADVDLFMEATASMVRGGGLMFVATINRTRKAQALAIFMAERVLRWLPQGTHEYEKLVRPEELAGPLERAGMRITDRTGVTYSIARDCWEESRDTDVNYMVLAERPADGVRASERTSRPERTSPAGPVAAEPVVAAVPSGNEAAAGGATDGKVEVRNVNAPDSTKRVDRAKYEAMRDAMMGVLPPQTEAITVAECLERVVPRLPPALFPEGAKAGWWQKTVQLDLEARGLVGRVATKPMRIHRT